MKKFLLISSILLGGVVASKGIPTLGGPTLSGAPTSGVGTNIVITTNGIDGATSSTIAQTNIAGKVPNMLLSGTNVFVGDGYGLTNVNTNLFVITVKEGGFAFYLNQSNNSVATAGGAVLSGIGNTIGTNQPASVIVGGNGNSIPSYSIVGSGWNFIGGGIGNSLRESEYSSIPGGAYNMISSSGYASILGGGYNNLIGYGSCIFGGLRNTNTANYTVFGGIANGIRGEFVFGLGHANAGVDEDTSRSGFFGSTNYIDTSDALVFGNALTNHSSFSAIVGYDQANLTLNHTANTATFSTNTTTVFNGPIVTASVLSTNHYYVATNGSDSNTGLHHAPWRSIGYAGSNAPLGAIIHVTRGQYTNIINRSGVIWEFDEGVYVYSASATTYNNLVVNATNGANIVIRGRGSFICATYAETGINVDGLSSLDFQFKTIYGLLTAVDQESSADTKIIFKDGFWSGGIKNFNVSDNEDSGRCELAIMNCRLFQFQGQSAAPYATAGCIVSSFASDSPTMRSGVVATNANMKLPINL